MLNSTLYFIRDCERKKDETVKLGSYYGLFSGIELLDLYAECSKEILEKIKPLLA